MNIAIAPVAFAAPSIAAEQTTDPIFAAIETYKRAFAFHGECLNKAEVIDTAIFEKRREYDKILENDTEGTAEKILAIFQQSQPDTTLELARGILKMLGYKQIEEENGGPEADRLRDEGSKKECDARLEMFSTVPTTAAGAAALLAFIREDIERGTTMADVFADDESSVLFQSLETFLCQQSV